MADEEDLIDFGPGQAAKLYPCKGGIVAVDGFIADAGVELMVVVVLEPEPESLVEFLQSDSLLNSGEETIPDGPEETFHKSQPAGRFYNKRSAPFGWIVRF